jgi:phosphoribosylglycinamide formyltransferase-1
MSQLRIAFLASGNGSTFQYLAEKLRADQSEAQPVLLLSSSNKARALERARQLKIPSAVIRRRDYPSDEALAEAMEGELTAHDINFVCLVGYLKLIPQQIVKIYSGRMLNVHPALLPAFGGEGMYGRRVHEAVIASRARLSGATIHLVDEEYDRGSIIAQQSVYVSPDDTPETLAQRVHAMEIQLYYSTILLFAEDRIQLNNGRTTILPPQST